MKLAVAAVAVTVVSALPQGDQWRSPVKSLKTDTSLWEHTLSAFGLGWTPVEASIAYVADAWGMLLDPPDSPDKQSVYQWLKSQSDFTKIVKLIEYDGDIVKFLDGASHGLTFFAPNNDALPDHHDKKGDEDTLLSAIHTGEANALSIIHSYISREDHHHHGGDDKDTERKKKILKEILHQVLLYHALPYDVTTTQLGANSTVATALKANDGSFDGQLRRIKIDRTTVPPSLTINKYASVIKSDIEATNGRINVLDHPLFPPPSVLDGVFLWPQKLSTFTSALQKVELENGIQYHYVHSKHGKGRFEGAPSVTVFAPTNDAFAALPEKLLLYLFSPFGKSALGKLLSYHVVPEFHVHSEWIYNVKDERRKRKGGVDATGTELDFTYAFPTGLKGTKVDVHIKKYTPTIPIPGVAYIDFEVQGTKVEEYDFVAKNGAWHIVNKVLDPRGKKGDSLNSWDDWEEWLPAWAEQE